MNQRFYAENLGCSPAQVDLERNVQRLLGEGVERTDDPADADILLLQTCSFLASQAEQSVARVLELQALAGRGARIVALGCAIDTERERLTRLDDDRLVLVGARDVWIPEGSDAPLKTGMVGGAGVRVSRGCASTCSFCSIRLSQGSVRSIPADELVRQIGEVLGEGQMRCNLYSEDVGAWGLDLGSNLPALLHTLHRHYPEVSFRINTVNPQWFHLFLDSLVELAKNGILDSCFYCPAQSGSTAVLRRMRRGYDAGLVDRVYNALFERLPQVQLFSDFILGTPGETLADVEETASLAERYPYTQLSIWALETREGTDAATQPDPIPAPERARRARQVAMRYLAAHWRREGIGPQEAAGRFLQAQLPLRSNVPLFQGPGQHHDLHSY